MPTSICPVVGEQHAIRLWGVEAQRHSSLRQGCRHRQWCAWWLDARARRWGGGVDATRADGCARVCLCCRVVCV